MSKLSRAAPTFPVADVGATIRWYETELGFNSYPFPENPPYVFASAGRDDVEIMFQRIEGYQKPDLYQRRNGGVWDAYIAWKASKSFTKRSGTRLRSPCRCENRAMGIGSSKWRIRTATFWFSAN